MRTHFPRALHEMRSGARVPQSIVICFETEEKTLSTEAKCPFPHTQAAAPANASWWPKQLNLKMLNQNSPLSDPMDSEFDYAKEFKSLDRSEEHTSELQSPYVISYAVF